MAAAAPPELEALAQEAERLEAGPADPAAPGAGADPTSPAPERDPARWNEDAGFFVGIALGFVTARTGVTYTEQTKRDGAERLGAVMAKYEDRWPLWATRYKEEFMLGAWCAGVAWKTWELVSADKAKRAAAAAEKKPEPASA